MDPGLRKDGCMTCRFMTCSFLRFLLSARPRLDKMTFSFFLALPYSSISIPCLPAWGPEDSAPATTKGFLVTCLSFKERHVANTWILCQTIAEPWGGRLSQPSHLSRQRLCWCCRTWAPLGITGMGKEGRSWQLWGWQREPMVWDWRDSTLLPSSPWWREAEDRTAGVCSTTLREFWRSQRFGPEATGWSRRRGPSAELVLI